MNVESLEFALCYFFKRLFGLLGQAVRKKALLINPDILFRAVLNGTNVLLLAGAL